MKKTQLSRHSINLCTHLDCSSIWHIYFIFIVMSKKIWLLLKYEIFKTLIPLGVKCSSRKPGCSRFPSWHSSKDPAKLLFWPAAQSFLLLSSLLSLKPAFTATTSTSTEAKNYSATVVKHWKTKGSLNCKQKRGKGRKDWFPISLLVQKT